MLVYLNGRGLSALIVPRILKSLNEWGGVYSEDDVEDIYGWLIEEALKTFFLKEQVNLRFFRTYERYFDLNRFVLDQIGKPTIIGLVEDFIWNNNLNFLVVNKLRCFVTYTDIILSIKKHTTFKNVH